MLNFIQESTGQAQRSDTNTFLPLGWLLHILYTENRKNESSLYKEMLKSSVFFVLFQSVRVPREDWKRSILTEGMENWWGLACAEDPRVPAEGGP